MEMAVKKMKSEVMILNIRAQDQKLQYEAIDRQVHQMIDNRVPDNSSYGIHRK